MQHCVHLIFPLETANARDQTAFSKYKHLIWFPSHIYYKDIEVLTVVCIKFRYSVLIWTSVEKSCLKKRQNT